MRKSLFVVSLFAWMLCGCARGPVVMGDSRFPFDTVNGGYGGNEFSALTPEGQRTLGSDAHAKTERSASPDAAAPAPTASAAPTAVASAVLDSRTASAPAETRIVIDANAFAAVFGPYSAPLKPSAAQLMQLDSLSLVAADATRIVLQQQILACRRAAESCRLASQ